MATNRVKNRYIVLVQSPVSIIMIGLDGNMKKNLLIPLGALMWGALTASAYAQNCDNLDGNALWRQLFVEFNDQIKAGDNHAALKTTQKLQEICKDSPVLNYAISRVYRNLGDHLNEVKYIQRATDNAYKFNVNEETLKTFWFTRYEAENPEAVASMTELENSQQTLKDLNAALAATEQRALASEHAGEKMQLELQYKEENIYKALMWSGVAVAGIGIAMTGVGAYLALNYKSKAVNIENGLSVNETWTSAWTLIGAGVAVSIVGAAVTGYGGFHYVRKNKEKESLSFNIGLTGALVSYTF